MHEDWSCPGGCRGTYWFTHGAVQTTLTTLDMNCASGHVSTRSESSRNVRHSSFCSLSRRCQGDAGTKHATIPCAGPSVNADGRTSFSVHTQPCGGYLEAARPNATGSKRASVAAAAVPLWEVERRFDTWEIYTLARTYICICTCRFELRCAGKEEGGEGIPSPSSPFPSVQVHLYLFQGSMLESPQAKAWMDWFLPPTSTRGGRVSTNMENLAGGGGGCSLTHSLPEFNPACFNPNRNSTQRNLGPPLGSLRPRS